MRGWKIGVSVSVSVAVLAPWWVFYSPEALAQVENAGILDDVMQRYQAAAVYWRRSITQAASRLFWVLVSISMVWTFGTMALRKADLGEFFAELVRFLVFTGLFWWLLSNGPDIAESIIRSLRQLGESANGGATSTGPSGIVDMGFDILSKAINNYSLWSPVYGALSILTSLVILVVCALVSINLVLIYVSAWTIAYAGVFLLGFGGGKWTSDIAVNYFKTVISLAVQIMTLILIVGVGESMASQYLVRVKITLYELAVMLVIFVTLLVLVNRLPAMIAGIVTGTNGQGMAQTGWRDAQGWMSTAAAAATAGKAALTQAGGMAIKRLTGSALSSQDRTAGRAGGAAASQQDAGGNGSAGGHQGTPLAQAAGFSGPANGSDASATSGPGGGQRGAGSTGGDGSRTESAADAPLPESGVPAAQGDAASVAAGQTAAATAAEGNVAGQAPPQRPPRRRRPTAHPAGTADLPGQDMPPQRPPRRRSAEAAAQPPSDPPHAAESSFDPAAEIAEFVRRRRSI